MDSSYLDIQHNKWRYYLPGHSRQKWRGHAQVLPFPHPPSPIPPPLDPWATPTDSTSNVSPASIRASPPMRTTIITRQPYCNSFNSWPPLPPSPPLYGVFSKGALVTWKSDHDFPHFHSSNGFHCGWNTIQFAHPSL